MNARRVRHESLLGVICTYQEVFPIRGRYQGWQNGARLRVAQWFCCSISCPTLAIGSVVHSQFSMENGHACPALAIGNVH